ncbi:MAG: LysM peptidoglycan-binding domain-containing protein [Desulfobacterota bacterium]|nr:LysM peptidoglycan-binding domain-containing protein [Thermodesulfobacteriota bacterium]
MSTIRRFAKLLPALTLLFFVGCTTTGPYEKEDRAAEKKAPPKVALPSEARETTSADKGTREDSRISEGMTNQDLLDSALEYAQAANDYWERGDIDNALEALDTAYFLILNVKTNDDADLHQQKEDLRFTISKRIVEINASRFTVAAGDRNSIPLTMNDHVRREIESFKGPERDFFMAAYRRSGKYRPAIIRTFKEAGMPLELTWLPLIESGYKVRALSRARALGLWQFIASTGYRYGLKRDQWVDERMDPDKSTVAAIAYLKELHQMFGDWTTALAGYNCGEWAVMNRIKTQKVNYLDNFWDLYIKLPQETAAYVPRLLAVLHIVSDPKAHGMTLPPLDPEIQTEEVMINKQVQIKTLASAIQVDEDLLGDLNAELRLNMTPDSPYPLKVPEGKGQLLLAKVNEIPAYCPPAGVASASGYILHKVRKGETIASISRKYRTSPEAVRDYNDFKKNETLVVGSKIKVPARTRTVQAKGTKAAAPAVAKEEKPVKYVVKKGDNLWQIASQHNTTAKELQSLNRLKGPSLHTGQVLLIPPGQVASCAVTPTRNYTVKGGETPFMIAKKHEMELGDFLKINNLTPHSTILPAQTVVVKAN